MKIKTHSGAKKRIKITASGKFKFRKSCKNHLLSHKSKEQKRVGLQGVVLNSSDVKKLKKLLPYS
ncbi:50S ribosomal protein L35 [Candidatus Peregrinibacteria bacterium CG1_02_41_10]|nr:MAG: 50S ribosomal protein L35 [Candidatus Peregrinibacteria bacterium CG1_02_41_10]